MDKKKQDIAYYVSFCIEQYKNAKHLTGAETLQLLDKSTKMWHLGPVALYQDMSGASVL